MLRRTRVATIASLLSACAGQGTNPPPGSSNVPEVPNTESVNNDVGDSASTPAWAPDSEAGLLALETKAASATSLHFTTSTTLPTNRPPQVDVIVTNVDVVRAIFQETISQPAAPLGPTSCPADFGIVYHLVFTSNNATTTADLDPNGCQMVTIDGAPGPWLEQTPQYWADLSRALGIAESAIYPYPGSD